MTRSTVPTPGRIDPWAGRRAASDKATARRTRAQPGRRAANPRPCRARAVAHSAARTPPSCTGNSRPPAMPEVPRRPGLRLAAPAGSATAGAGSWPVGCRWTGGERRDERVMAEAETAKDSSLAKAVAASTAGGTR